MKSFFLNKKVVKELKNINKNESHFNEKQNQKMSSFYVLSIGLSVNNEYLIE